MSSGNLRYTIRIKIEGENLSEKMNTISEILDSYPGNWETEFEGDDLVQFSGICHGTYYEYESFNFYEPDEYDEELDFYYKDIQHDLQEALQDCEVAVSESEFVQC